MATFEKPCFDFIIDVEDFADDRKWVKKCIGKNTNKSACTHLRGHGNIWANCSSGGQSKWLAEYRGEKNEK